MFLEDFRQSCVTDLLECDFLFWNSQCKPVLKKHESYSSVVLFVSMNLFYNYITRNVGSHCILELHGARLYIVLQ